MNGSSDNRSDAALIADSIGAIIPSDAYNVQSVRFRYQTRESQGDRWILDGVSFQVQTGEVLGVVGPNGSGKTSLLKVLGRVLTPEEVVSACSVRPWPP
ncbi:MAG: ATP-binding cassette domain-containing protein [Nitrospira sp.]|nr:ATP-binding cassette domain-containing protein [Nitrospira sp.]